MTTFIDIFSSYTHLSIISISLLLSFTFILLTFNKKRLNLPPNPPAWPVVGNLFQVANSGKAFFEYVRDLLPMYGPIFTLKMGTRTMIIISSGELAYEALITKGQVFATRPADTPTRAIFSNKKFTVNSAYHGPVWRSLRRNMVQNGVNTTRLREFKPIRMVAMDRLIQRFKTEAENANGVVSVLKHVRFAVFYLLLTMCFGIELSEKTIDEVDHIMKMILITVDPRIDDFFPILSPFFTKQRKQAADVRKKQIEVLRPLIERRQDLLRAGLRSDPTAASFSYLDTLFELQIEGRKSGLNEAEIVTLCSEFLNGGTDTTATAIEWGVARFLENPTMQARIYEEIRAKVGSRPIEEKDLDDLVYLHAFVKEVLRKHPPTYFALTHAVMEPTTIAGYDIPVGAHVEFYLPAIADDPKLWSNPKKFDPERFLTGGEEADITGVKGVKMMPFGAGRRICPGLNMATTHLHLMIATMIQQFEWTPYPEGSKVDMTEQFEFTVVMKNTPKAKIKPRVHS